MRKATDQRDAQTISLLWTSLLLFHGADVPGWWFDQFWCHEVGCGVRWSNQGTTPVLLCTAKYLLQYYSQYYSVLQSTTPVLLSTTQYYNVLLQYYSVLQSITLYCKGLLQYYSVLQSTTPVLLCTTKYYSSTTLYYTVLQPVLHCTTKQHSWLTSVAYETSFTMRGATGVILQRHEKCHQWSASHMKRHFQCAEQVKSPFKLTNYCACHAKWISWLIRVTYETSFTMRGATG